MIDTARMWDEETAVATLAAEEAQDLEFTLLGNIISAGDKRRTLWLLAELEREHLHFGQSKRLYDALQDVIAADEEPNSFAVIEEVKRQGLGHGDASRLVFGAVERAVDHAIDRQYAVRLIRRRAEDRTFLTDLRSALAEATDGGGDRAEIKARLVSKWLQAPQRTAGPIRLRDAILNEQGRLFQEESVPALLSGIPAIDRLAGGLEATQMGIIAGRPGAGKTALAMQLLMHAANKWGPTAFISLEMGEDQLARRVMASVTRHSYRELRDGGQRDRDGRIDHFSKAELERIAQQCRKFAYTEHDIWVETTTFRMSSLIQRLHAMKLDLGIRAVVIDYGQLLTEDRRKTNSKTEEMSGIARSLKNEIANPLAVPVWVLAQPNRSVESRGEGGRLKMGDLGWSSEWEAVSSQIWLLNKDAAYGHTETQTGIILEVVKGRNDAKGDVELVFHGPRFRFTARGEEWTDDYAPPERSRYADD